MARIHIEILRHDPDVKENKGFVKYAIKKKENSTVLEGLLQIYEKNDSTLAFSYGCRVKNCGLCAVEVNGKPCYACLTKVKDGIRLSPLKHLPIIKDLVFDRKPFFRVLDSYSPYVVREDEPEFLPEIIKQPDEHVLLMSCRECFGCMSLCPKYDYRDGSFGGPLGFVKLAQLHYDCRDTLDRRLHAEKMGISKCKDCKRCACIFGIPIHDIVIKQFL